MEHQQFVVEGVKVVKELLASPCKVDAIYCLEEYRAELLLLLADNTNSLIPPLAGCRARSDKHPEPETITEQQLQKISNLETPNKVLAVATLPQSPFSFHQVKDKLALALDTINDPGNLGTIIRTAAWFGIDTIICSPNTADAWNPKAVQATMGALFRTNVVYADLKKIVEEYNNAHVPVYATTLDGTDIYKTTLSPNGLIVIGSESHGVSPELLALINNKLLIPSFSSGAAESLNAAVAAGVVCSEFKRGVHRR
ncbi:MAG: 23S rRNA (guanosine-2'-O-)-methyltransferase RlmB [Bacteroidia bacterium]|nr:23S rRNA (guanosine-2'-O-)-methyltransferase RlmB [Bacteroidia bacterium]